MESVAHAAAHASIPGPNDSVPLDSLDAKIVQYHYATQKILKLTSQVKTLIKNSQTEDLVPSYKDSILLSGVIFNVNDNIYRRSEVLINGNKFNPAQSIEPTLSLAAVSFDCMDNSTNYDTTTVSMPVMKKSIDQLRLLELLLINAFEIYNTRLKQAMLERSSFKSTALTFSELSDLEQFPELLNIPMLLNNPIKEVPATQEKIKAYLREQDMKFLKLNLEGFEASIAKLKEHADSLLLCRTKDGLMNHPHHQVLLHRSLILLLRYADI
ncbi:unnamed protein product [Ambrosiozyma monospora]|uniref:Unnamed protein product n=1 Tax=Ambrosiozyma monospora TaxID=43982 RepID=A0ACB5SUR5_AMBMO|nr:unnamed protein product [Ambrosiozyma monospora]